MPRTNNTIMFVAFDFEEDTPECNIPWPITCGSRSFVKNLTGYLANTKGTVYGALVLETIINHNTSAGIQFIKDHTQRNVTRGPFREMLREV